MTTPTNPSDERATPQREVGLADEVRRAADALNTHIARAAEFGLRIEVDTLSVQSATRLWPTPVVTVQVTKTVQVTRPI